jgi:hypothetical protein
MRKSLIVVCLLCTAACGITELDSENADRDLTSIVTVLTHTPSASAAMFCQGLIMLGDGSKNLDGTGGSFELTVTIGGQTVQPDPSAITFSTAARSCVWTDPFVVPDNNEVLLRFKSPNAGDTDVDVTAYLFDIGINDISAKLPTNYIMGSSDQTDKDDEIGAVKAIVDILPVLQTTVASPNDVNNFTITAGLDANDVYEGSLISVQDAGDSHWETRLIIQYEVGRDVTVDQDFGFTPAGSDEVVIWNNAYFPASVSEALPADPPMEFIYIDDRT